MYTACMHTKLAYNYDESHTLGVLLDELEESDENCIYIHYYEISMVFKLRACISDLIWT